MKFQIPLSYNPIHPEAIVAVLKKYEERHHNDIIADFEQSLCEVTGATHAVALSSGTSAIHLALNALGVGPDDYVVAPTFTYVATVNPILYLRAQPVLIDSEPVTWNMDPELLEDALNKFAKIRKMPKAIIVVHTYGIMADMEAISSIADKWSIPVVEDAAEALGSALNGKSAGTWGMAGIFSFNNNKLVTSYGGGAVITNNAGLAARIRFLATQSREQNIHYEHHEVGYNYQMGPVNAACGLASLQDLKKNANRRKSFFEAYKQELSDQMTFPAGFKNAVSNHWLTVGLFDSSAIRDRVFSNLIKCGIEARLCWKPMHLQPLFKGVRSFVRGFSEEAFQRGICLPSGNGLTASDIEMVVENIKKSI